MKIVSAEQMSSIEKKAYAQGFTEHAFMEKAGEGVASAARLFMRRFRHPISTVWLLCGKGNNGGDAFVAGRHLIEAGYRVVAVRPEPVENCSPLSRKNAALFLDAGGQTIKHIPDFGREALILDGIFGTGFKGEVREPYTTLIEAANASRLPILAIDIASGLNGSTGTTGEFTVRATETLFLGLPKIGFFLENGWNVTGKLTRVDFGLPESLIAEIGDVPELLTEQKISSLLPEITRNRHKYQTGSVVGIAGSPSMPGAALLSSLAAFRGGAGMVRLFYPAGMESGLSSAPYELIKIPYKPQEAAEILEIVDRAGSVFIGPGLGTSPVIDEMLKQLFLRVSKPCVIDADALKFQAETGIAFPQHAILTPHTGEMKTLLNSENPLRRNEETLHRCRQFAKDNRVCLILKGAPSFIFHPDSPILVNPTGDPGMATAGSGDVLTGLLAALLAQGLTCPDAACVGVYLHGLSGELARKKRRSSRGMTAGDLIDSFPEAFALLEHSIKPYVV